MSALANTNMKQTKFDAWVKAYGVKHLARVLGAGHVDNHTTFSAIYKWLRGDNMPSPNRMAWIELISKGPDSPGKLEISDIFDHYYAKKGQREC